CACSAGGTDYPCYTWTFLRPRYLFAALSVLSVLNTFLWVTPAYAELVFFANGQSMSVKAHRIEGDSLVLTMRAGGEIVCDPAVVTRIAPDEVPYPEPEEIDRAMHVQTDVQAKPGAPSDATPAQYGAIIDTVAAKEGVDPRLV